MAQSQPVGTGIDSAEPGRISGDSTRKADTSQAFREVSILLEIKEACIDDRYRIGWDLINLDSGSHTDTLILRGYRYDEGESMRQYYKPVGLDSSDLYEIQQYYLVSPGYYWLEYADSARGIRYSSNEIHITLCARFQLPERYTPGYGNQLRPVYSQSIERIELVIFNGSGEEVFSTRDPQFKWDGKNRSTGTLCPPGTYFYHCDVYEKVGEKIIWRNLTGMIEFTY